MRPVNPGRNDAGRNTEISTSVMPTIGANSASIALIAASCPDMPCSILGAAPSTTTMASSTTMPIASTIANSVERLMVKPSAAIAANAPMMVTGTVVAGTSMARQACRNSRMTASARRPAAMMGYGSGGARPPQSPPVLQEQQNDSEHQKACLDQRHVHLMDRRGDEF